MAIETVTYKYNESVNYPFAVRNMARKLAKDRKGLDSLKEDHYGISLKEAATSDAVRAFLPELFIDEIIKLGLVEAWARQIFPVTGQSSHDSYIRRFRKKTTGCQIIHELNVIRHSTNELSKIRFEYNKLVDSSLFSFERNMDFDISDTVDEILLATSGIYRRENQLMLDQLCRWSSGDNGNEWNNYIEGPEVANCDDPYLASGNAEDADNLLEAMQNAYLSITTALTDKFDPSQLLWIWGPAIMATLWKSPTFRQWQLGGVQSSTISGNIPNPFGIPYKVVESPGVFTNGNSALGSEFVHDPCCILLVAPAYAAGIRERVSLRLDGLTKEEIQASGAVLWERISCSPRHPKAYRRISPNRDYPEQIEDQKDIIIKLHEEEPPTI